jgi:hypothetical protein
MAASSAVSSPLSCCRMHSSTNVRATEGLPAGHVLPGQGQHPLHGRDGTDGDRQPLLRQVRHQVEEAAVLDPAQVLGRDADVVEEQLGGVLSRQPDLLHVAPPREARHVTLDDEQADALRPAAGSGLDDDDDQVGVDAVGDERLGAVEHPAVAVLARGGLDPLQVAAGARLGSRDGGDQLTAAEPGQPALLSAPRSRGGADRAR